MTILMDIFKDRTLNTAILISVSWHFFCMFLFNPVAPAGNIKEYGGSISFLGGILENVSPGNKKLFTPDNASIAYEINKAEPVEPGFINTRLEKKDIFYPQDNYEPLNLDIYRRKESARVDFSGFFIKGDARDRVIVYKPDMEKVVMLPSDFSSDFSSTVKFMISRDGFVKYAECVISSGFPEIDREAVRYIRKWQFAPEAEDNQEGVIRVSFE